MGVRIFKSAESARVAMRKYGPAILKTNYGGLPRLQTYPGPDDKSGPHVEGRALDIILLAARDSEQSIADYIVERFLAFSDEIAWETMIYNQVEYGAFGSSKPRLLTPQVKNPGRDYEHKTHIHVQWPMAGRDFSRDEAIMEAMRPADDDS